MLFDNLSDEHEIENLLSTRDGTFNVQYINILKSKVLVAKRYSFNAFKKYGIKRITATNMKQNKFKTSYKELKVEFDFDNRRYITLPNADFNINEFIKSYESLFKIWQQCIVVLKMIESENVNNIKLFIDDMKFYYLVNADLDNINGISKKMKSKIFYIRKLYFKGD